MHGGRLVDNTAIEDRILACGVSCSKSIGVGNRPQMGKMRYPHDGRVGSLEHAAHKNPEGASISRNSPVTDRARGHTRRAQKLPRLITSPGKAPAIGGKNGGKGNIGPAYAQHSPENLYGSIPPTSTNPQNPGRIRSGFFLVHPAGRTYLDAGDRLPHRSGGGTCDETRGVVEGLSRFPDHGSHPKELVALGIKEYRQASFKPYRVIFRVTNGQVIIYLIADGRRDMQSLLARRLRGA